MLNTKDKTPLVHGEVRPGASYAIDESIIAVQTQRYEEMRQEFASGNYNIQNPYIVLDPYLSAPLSAQIGIKTSEPTRLSVQILPMHSGKVFSFNFPNYTTEHFVPLYGLYPGVENMVVFTARPMYGAVVHEYLHRITTQPLPEDFGQIDVIHAAQTDRLNDEFYYTTTASSYPAAIGTDGEVRWYLHETYDGLPHNFQGNSPLIVLKNGHLLIKHITYEALIEADQSGRVYRFFQFPFRAHHDFYQMANNNLLVQSEDTSMGTIEDMMVVVDYISGQIINTIDFKPVLDVNRIIQPNPPADYKDWLHTNSVTYHEPTNTYITSGRHQNLVFATDMDTNDIRWLLGPHYQWSEEFVPYLLTPVDESGNPLYDFSNPDDVKAADRDFWNWGQHSARVFPQTESADTIDIFIFDNGNFRSYEPDNQLVPYENWSRVVRYRINHREMTVRIVWEYGRELGQEYYCAYVSNAEYIPETNSMMINFGGTNADLDTGRNMGIPDDLPDEAYEGVTILEKTKIQEIDIDTKEVLFEFHQYHKDRLGIYQNFTYKAIKAGLYTAFGASDSVYVRNGRTDRFNYTGSWATTSSSNFSNGIAMVTSEDGAAFEFVFVGTAFRVISRQGDSQSTFDVYIDDEFIANVDLYATDANYNVIVFEKDTLNYDFHRVRLIAHASETRNMVTVDAVEIMGFLLDANSSVEPAAVAALDAPADYVRYEEADRFRYSGVWNTRRHAVEGYAFLTMETREADATLEFAFHGTSFRIFGVSGPLSNRMFAIYIDGEYITSVYTYNHNQIFNYWTNFYENNSLTNDTHNVKLVILSTGIATHYVSLGAIEIKGTLLDIWNLPIN